MKNKNNIKFSLCAALALTLSASSAFAAQLNYFNTGGWTAFSPSTEDTTVDKVDPGFGGQAFDAEYLYWKQEGSTLSLGIQTGFDISLGHQEYGTNKYYWAGDLALDIGDTGYKYVVDFGFKTAGYSDRSTTNPASKGTAHAAGFYEVDTWNNDIYFDSGSTDSTPFAMQTAKGSSLTNIITTASSGNNNGDLSYYRIVSFNLSDVLTLEQLTQGTTIGAHWTMSCGNDEIEGTFNTNAVPEPTTMLLFGTGIAAFAGISRKKMRK